jgi:hypothetical protein
MILMAWLLHSQASAQLSSALEILTEAERVFPDAKVPELFGPGAASASYAEEAEDRNWSADMEARILAAVEQERDQGLIIRRAEVECRTSTCALLLIHAANREEGTIADLKTTLRDSLGFSGVSMTSKEIPMVRGEPTASGGRTTWFMSGYVELILFGAVNGAVAGR